MEIETFICSGKSVTLYKSEQPNRPLVVLNNYDGDGAPVTAALREIAAPDCNLLSVGDLNWNHDMTPWYCPPLSARDAPCTGGADAYLRLLLEEILPEAKGRTKGVPPYTGIAGYSLAGLFAVYALYRCDAFSAAASVSGSLWFPGFRDYVLAHDLRRTPRRVYLSLGDREARTKNRLLRTAQSSTEEIAAHYAQLGLPVTWELNPGNHFKDAPRRSAKGIKAILE